MPVPAATSSGQHHDEKSRSRLRAEQMTKFRDVPQGLWSHWGGGAALWSMVVMGAVCQTRGGGMSAVAKLKPLASARTAPANFGCEVVGRCQ
eukprot:2531161-Rhodomonas_salina.3